ncbi:MmcQ/YjbR family DNA-binding protein [Albimonas sp. CAU 1670]|uniref:MmcQ/YjbR family DNA-binding protein n=1 Tax=Albimonas sp. CAU 1670 TaxID=3032599 RepID=UPI0023DAE7EB|nr:MmcQ/YjbR family DNA-binding protein [Albimonas sp. CAU 1670]MDF2233129.1 MmcQ/YjbR family DNA-binding protein [Albimonas sp. CAU 1670]
MSAPDDSRGRSEADAPRIPAAPTRAKAAPGSPLERLRALALALPRTSEKLSWGEPTFRVDDRIFAMVKGGDGEASVWLKAPDGAQEMLIAAAPERFFRPPYVGQKGWIGIRLARDPDWEEVAFNLARSHELIAARGARRRDDAG